jgi:putative transposase
MTEMVTKRSSREAEWRLRLARFAASGLPVRQFCDAEAVSNATFYSWQKKLGKAVATSPGAGFIDVGPMPAPPRAPVKVVPASAALEVRLELGHGLVLHIVRH